MKPKTRTSPTKKIRELRQKERDLAQRVDATENQRDTLHRMIRDSANESRQSAERIRTLEAENAELVEECARRAGDVAKMKALEVSLREAHRFCERDLKLSKSHNEERDSAATRREKTYETDLRRAEDVIIELQGELAKAAQREEVGKGQLATLQERIEKMTCEARRPYGDTTQQVGKLLRELTDTQTREQSLQKKLVEAEDTIVLLKSDASKYIDAIRIDEATRRTDEVNQWRAAAAIARTEVETLQAKLTEAQADKHSLEQHLRDADARLTHAKEYEVYWRRIAGEREKSLETRTQELDNVLKRVTQVEDQIITLKSPERSLEDPRTQAFTSGPGLEGPMRIECACLRVYTIGLFRRA